MALNLGTLRIALQLDNADFRRGLSSARKDLDGMSTAAARGVTAVARGLGGALSAVAKTAGVLFTTATAGAAGLLVAVTKTGVSYNALQQSTRAALTTILGGAEAANAQMDKLDAFAKTSPFAKQVFIKAQQQLLGFGLQAEKVVPTLQAIQDAVAAVGGSNDDIAGIAYVLAQVTGTGKITAETLNMLGIRGINAAQLIADQMGITAQEVRDKITDGSLDAGKALDDLVAGMEKSFGGAAANVKETWSGATDRIKAAWRDIGSAIAEPFVGHEGGGAAIVWVNQFADLMRAVQAQVGPVINVIVGRLMPAFDKIGPALVRARAAVTGFDASSLTNTLDKLAKYAPLISGVSAALFTLGTRSVPYLGALTGAINPVVAGIVALVAASPELRGVTKDFLDGLKPALPVLEQLGKQIVGTLLGAIRDLAPVLDQVVKAVAPVIVAFASGLPPVVGVVSDVLHGLTPVLKAVATAFEGVAKALQFVAPLLPTVLAGLLAYKAVAVVMGGVTMGLQRMAQSAAVATYSVGGTLGRATGTASTGLSKAASAASKAGAALPIVALAAVAVASAMEASSQKTDKLAQALLDGGKAAEDARRQMGDLKSTMKDTDPGFLADMVGIGSRAAAAAKAMNEAKQRAKEMRDAMSPLDRAQQDVTKATNDLAYAQEKWGYGSAQAQGAAVALGDAQQRLKEKQDAVANATKTATDRLAEQAAQALGAANAQLAVSQAAVSLRQAQDDYNKTLADGNATADQRTTAENNLTQSYLNAAQAAAQKAAADNAGKSQAEINAASTRAQIDTLNAFIQAAGGEAPQAVLDYIHSLQASAQQSDLTKAAIEGVHGAITAMPDGKTIIVKSLTDEAKAALIAIGAKVTTLPDGRIEVTANTAAAQGAIDNLIARNAYRSLPINVNVGGIGANYARAGGGDVWPGPTFLVGEHGPEIVRFAGRGEVIPADKTAQIMAGRGQPAAVPVAAPAAAAGTDRVIIHDNRQVYAQVDARALARAMAVEQRDQQFLAGVGV